MSKEKDLIIKGNRDFFWQWDVNQFVELVGIQAEEVHFQTDGRQAEVVRTIEQDGKLYAPVPQHLLEKPCDIIAYAYDKSLLEGGFDIDGAETPDYSGNTVFKRKFKVRDRQEPGDRPTTPEQEHTFDSLLGKAIVKVEQFQSSLQGGGLNILRIHFWDKTYTDFNIYNGKDLKIDKKYNSIEEMNQGFATDGLPTGSIVVISTDENDPDNASLYIKGEASYEFMVDISGGKGIQGPAGEITDVTASVDNNVGLPSVDVSLGGTPEFRTFHLDFKNLRGQKGDIGDVGPVGPVGPEGPEGRQGKQGDPFVYDDFTPDQLESLRGPSGTIISVTASADSGIGTPSVDITLGGTEQKRTLDFVFHNIKGQTGDKGDKGEKGDPGDFTEARLQEALKSKADQATTYTKTEVNTNFQSNLHFFIDSDGYICQGEQK